MPNLRNQFDKALTNIEINGQKRKRAIDAHTEIRELLQQDEQLKEWGVEPLLIGSYGRDVGIYPGKDVDVFLRFTKLDTRSAPRAVFDAVWRVLVRKYGQYGKGGGRAQQQARSVKVLFPDRDRVSEEIFLSMQCQPCDAATCGQSRLGIRTGGFQERAAGSRQGPYVSGALHRLESIGLEGRR